MSKKLTFGKILGIIFCVLAAAGRVVLLWANAYFGGQMKVIDKYYTALERDDFEGYKACLAEYLQEDVTEEWFTKSKKQILILQDNEKTHAKAEFVGRERYYVIYDLTVYNDSESVKLIRLDLPLIRKNGKWFITETC